MKWDKIKQAVFMFFLFFYVIAPSILLIGCGNKKTDASLGMSSQGYSVTKVLEDGLWQGDPDLSKNLIP